MASVNTNGNARSTANAAAAPRKRRAAARKSIPPSIPGSKSAARKPSAPQGPTEILFKETPSPYSEPLAPFVWIDHPQENEQLSAPVYVIRLGVGGADAVELSTDKGPWETCRLTSGYWWYDWAGIARGKHTLVARMRTAGGQWYRTPIRNIVY